MKINNNQSNSRTMIIGPVAWGGVWGHGPELARYLSSSRTVEYYDPPRPPKPGAPSFSEGDSYPVPTGLHVVRRKSRYNPGLCYGLAMEWNNFRAALSSRADSLVTYYASGLEPGLDLVQVEWATDHVRVCRFSGYTASPSGPYPGPWDRSAGEYGPGPCFARYQRAAV